MRRVSRQCNATADATWRLWETFWATLQFDAHHLRDCDTMSLLHLFAQRYRTGTIAPGRHPVRSRTLEDAIRAVGQTYARLGAPDPRLNVNGEVDLRLTSLFRAWRRDDEPPTRVKPLPALPVVACVYSVEQKDPTPRALAAADMFVIGFFFLLRPGEYLGIPPIDRSGPIFRLQDIQLWIG